MMPEYAPCPHSCTTHAAGWLQNAHPDPSNYDVPVDNTVCFAWTDNEC